METCENGTLQTEDRSSASGGTDQPGESQSIFNHPDAVCSMVYVHNNLLMFGLDEVQIERLEKANKQTASKRHGLATAVTILGLTFTRNVPAPFRQFRGWVCWAQKNSSLAV
jgi:hypothetical protein